MNGKPDWKDAPEWAKFLAMDQDGDWYWFENKPFHDGFIWSNYNGQYELALESTEKWKKSLEERPQ